MLQRDVARRSLPLVVAACFVLSCLGLVVAHRMHDTSRRTIPLSFPHAPHAQFGCVMCHHNVVEPALQDAPVKGCVACHKLTPALSAQTEQMFHQLCEGCHRAMKQDHQVAGPVKDCSACHFSHHPPVVGTFLYR